MTSTSKSVPDDLRIFIAATPKTGNVWLKNLLASVYSLRIEEVGTELSDDELTGLGSGWIAHQHLSPTNALLKRLREHRVTVLTMFRHPCDVLISLKSFIAKLDDPVASDHRAATMIADGDSFGDHTLAYVRSFFPQQLNVSLFWAKYDARPVHYEDLLKDPVQVVRSLGSLLGEAPIERIRNAVEQTSLERMRKKHAKTAFHFREGRAGKWRDTLPEPIKEAFRSLPPYPAQFKAMGYSMEEKTVDVSPAHKENSQSDETVAPSSEFLETLFDELQSSTAAGWKRPVGGNVSGSFLNWLNAPCEEDRVGAQKSVPITNLAKSIYDRRPDLQRKFPKLFDEDRLSFATWFLLRSQHEYGLNLSYQTPLFMAVASPQGIELEA